MSHLLSPARAPRLAGDLRHQVEALTAPPYAALPGTDDPGFRIEREPTFHPAAERAALQLRAARVHPAEPETIAAWLEPLAVAVANPPSDDKLTGFAVVLAMTCGEFPLPVWQCAHIEALQTFKFWPAAAEIHALLSRHDERQKAELSPRSIPSREGAPHRPDQRGKQQPVTCCRHLRHHDRRTRPCRTTSRAATTCTTAERPQCSPSIRARSIANSRRLGSRATRCRRCNRAGRSNERASLRLRRADETTLPPMHGLV